MNLKLVVLVVCCLIIAASAKPAGKGKGNGKDKGKGKGGKGGPVKPLVKLCTDIDSGDIANTDADYDTVFSELDTVCTELLAYTDSQVSVQNKKKGGKKGGKGDEGGEGEDKNAVKALLGVCMQIDMAVEKGLPEDFPTELSDIFDDMDPICDDAKSIAMGGPEEPLVKLCEAIENGDIANTDTEFDTVFSNLDTVCTELLAYTETEVSSMKKGGKKGGKGGKGGDDEDKNAVKALLGVCMQIDKAVEDGLPEDFATELSDIFDDMDPICDDAKSIVMGGPEEPLVKLCEAIENGDLANTDADYDSVFSDLDTVCTELLAYTETEVSTMKKKGGKKGGKGGKGEKNAVKALLGVCKKVDEAVENGLPDDFPTELSDIFDDVEPICDAAEAIYEA